MGIVTRSPPSFEAQIGKLHLPVLIDSGSARSLISFSHYQQLNRGGQVVELSGTEVPCVAATGHSLAIAGEVKVTVKIHGFSWPWVFLVSKRLLGQPILGADFIAKTRMLLDISQNMCYFHVAPQVKISFVKRKGAVHCAQMTFLSFGSSQVKCGKLNPQQRMKLETLIQQYQAVLTGRLGCTHLGDYDIQLLDKTPVRLPPYRLAPSKMLFLREHIQQLLNDGVIEPSCSNYWSPIFLVPKAGGTYLAVVDFRALNKRISIESVPLPYIHSAFHWFAGAK
jgi:hypothetical protein